NFSRDGPFGALQTASRGPRRARQRAGRALRARQLAVEHSEPGEVRRTDQGPALVQIEDCARPGARRTAGVARPALAVRGAELRELRRADQPTADELGVALVAVAVVVVVALAARQRRPRIPREEVERLPRIGDRDTAVAEVPDAVGVEVRLVRIRDV